MRLFIVSFFLLASLVLSFSEDLFLTSVIENEFEETDKKDSIPDHIRESYLKALEFYPELKDQKIRFKKANIKTTLNVRPTLASLLFSDKENRTYVIRINNSAKKEEILIHDIPFNARVGLFGHELAHIVDYKSLNTFQVMGRGIGYTFPGYKEKYEKKIDHFTVETGLGQNLYDWATYIQEHPKVPENYKLFKKQYYLQREDILRAMIDINVTNAKSGF